MHKKSFDVPTVAVRQAPSSQFIGRGVTLVMAAACGFVVANVYYNQPILEIMERTFPGRSSVVGLVPTATQLGFALD